MNDTPPQLATGVISYGGNYSDNARDTDHIRILSIFHYIAGSLAILFSSLFVFYIFIGIAALRGKFAMMPSPNSSNATMTPNLFAYIFIAVGSAGVLIGWAFGVLMICSGICMGRRRARLLSMVVAGVSCAFVPIGTVLGVFTLIVLLRESVRLSYLQQR